MSILFLILNILISFHEYVFYSIQKSHEKPDRDVSRTNLLKPISKGPLERRAAGASAALCFAQNSVQREAHQGDMLISRCCYMIYTQAI